MVHVSGSTKIRYLQNDKLFSFLLLSWAEKKYEKLPIFYLQSRFITGRAGSWFETWIKPSDHQGQLSALAEFCLEKGSKPVKSMHNWIWSLVLFFLLLWFQNTKGQRCVTIVNSCTNREDSGPCLLSAPQLLCKESVKVLSEETENWVTTVSFKYLDKMSQIPPNPNKLLSLNSSN